VTPAFHGQVGSGEWNNTPKTPSGFKSRTAHHIPGISVASTALKLPDPGRKGKRQMARHRSALRRRERTEIKQIKCTGALRALRLNLVNTKEPALRERLMAAIAKLEARP
jgi:hypothetical protein